MSKLEKVLKALKTRKDVTALGFSKDEIKSLASDIDQNLDFEEDAAEEDVENGINTAIESIIPVLKLAQKASSRIVKKKLQEIEEQKAADEDEDDEQEDVQAVETPKAKVKVKKTQKQPTEDKDDEVKTLLKSMMAKIEKQDEAINRMMNGTVTEKRKARLQERLKDAGTLGKTYLRLFDKMKFEDDADFEKLLNDAEDDLKAYQQDIADKGMEKMTQVPPKPEEKEAEKESEVEVMSDEEIDAMVED